MTSYEAIMIAEGDQPSTEETYTEAWQYLINTGLCWKLQGWFGREATRMIEEGVCHEHEEVTKDD